MSTAQVGAGAVAIFPTFKGFRRGVASEVDGVTRESGTRFTKGFSTAGTTAGRGFTDGFKRQTSNVSADALKKATEDVAKSTRDLATARLKVQDASGKVRVAEAALTDARRRYGNESVQAIRAEERLATAQRQLVTAQDSVENSTERLTRAKRSMADASQVASSAGGGGGWRNAFGGFGNQAADGFTSRFRSKVGEIFTGNFLAGVALSIGRTIVRGTVQGIQTGIQFAYDGIGLASDLRESLNAAQVAFGDEIGDQLRILSESAPTRLALTRRAFLQFSTQFSAFAKVIRRDNPAEFIDQLTERGADFASVYNLDVSEALGVFQSGLAGQTEPLRKYGIDLSAASVNAYAWANGITATGKALTENEKVQARWGLLLEQTSAVQGDNANTSGELAGQQRRLAVAFEEAQTKLGEYLIPGFLSLVTIANKDIIPAFGEVIDRVGPKLGAALEKVDWAGFASELEPVLENIGELVAEEGLPALIDGMRTAADLAPDVFRAVNQDLRDMIDLVKIARGDFTRPYEDNRYWLDPISESLAKVSAVMGDRLADLGIKVNQDLSALPPEWADTLKTGTEQAMGEQFRTALRGSVKSGVGGAFTSEFAAQVASNLKRGGGGAYDLGLSVGQGIESGLKASKGTVGRAAADLANSVKDQVRFTLQINSPSRVMQLLGQQAGDGLVVGLRDREQAVVASTRALFAQLPSSSQTGAQGGSAGASAALPPIYVQNPWTGEYLLAQARSVAGEVVREGKASTAAAVAGGVVR